MLISVDEALVTPRFHLFVEFYLCLRFSVFETRMNVLLVLFMIVFSAFIWFISAYTLLLLISGHILNGVFALHIL